jgi:hypothetical protein
MVVPEMPVCCVDIGYVTEQTGFVYLSQDIGCLHITQTCQEQLKNRILSSAISRINTVPKF